ncbi:amidohydrolase [Lachnospiraceae bacterium XBB1006]|nr:amidohydrolase [Lachnospiraceae bacterium XBB1006]
MKKEHLDQIVSLRHELHEHAELSMQETFTKNRLYAFVKENTDLILEDRGRWFYALKKGADSTKKPVAFRADFDAVAIAETCDLPYLSKNPGVGHKCGHDGHASVLCGLALALSETIPPQDTYLVFQHAEETGEGGEECARLMKEKQIGRVYAFHNRSGYPRHAVVYRRGLTQCASKGLTISFVGKPAHASQPEDGVNPAHAIATIILYAEELVQSDQFEEMVLCSVIHTEIGHKNFGVNASTGEVSMTLRANREEEMERLEQLLRQKAQTLAKEQQMQVSFAVCDPFPETRNHDDALDAVLAVAEKQGLKILSMEQPWRASEDFGYYTKQTSGAMIYIGNGETYPMVHTGEYDFCDEIIPTVVTLFYALAMEN